MEYGRRMFWKEDYFAYTGVVDDAFVIEIVTVHM